MYKNIKSNNLFAINTYVDISTKPKFLFTMRVSKRSGQRVATLKCFDVFQLPRSVIKIQETNQQKKTTKPIQEETYQFWRILKWMLIETMRVALSLLCSFIHLFTSHRSSSIHSIINSTDYVLFQRWVLSLLPFVYFCRCYLLLLKSSWRFYYL